jgi:hypothetical protein
MPLNAGDTVRVKVGPRNGAELVVKRLFPRSESLYELKLPGGFTFYHESELELVKKAEAN